MTDFHSHTVQLPPGTELDPLILAGNDGCYFSRDGMTIATKGVAARFELSNGIDDTSDLRRCIELFRSFDGDQIDNQPGTGAVLLGAVPFDPSQPMQLIVPELSYVRERDGSEWITHIGTTSTPATTANELASLLLQSACQGSCETSEWHSPSSPATSSKERLEHLSSTSSADYEKMVEVALEAIDGKMVDKVVLAREVLFRTEASYDPISLLRYAQSQVEPLTYFHLGSLIGASPELLISKMDRVISSCPLAGTRELSQWRDKSPANIDGIAGKSPNSGNSGLPASPTNDSPVPHEQQELEHSIKDLAEHRFVVDAVTRTISPLCSSIMVPPVPQALSLQTLVHLSTPIKGVLAEQYAQLTVLELVSLLHPTPAVGGVPKDKAISLIKELEPFERGNYGGAVGWMDKAGNGEWAIAIRCAEVEDHVVRMLAGAGIVRGSVPNQEAAETAAKIRSTLQLFWPESDPTEINKALAG
ncbi:MAG: chorismate-binding protein [Actinobacteria bacterium]|nr:chorismate-binding protein [Actinomycetota bacterium]